MSRDCAPAAPEPGADDTERAARRPPQDGSL